MFELLCLIISMVKALEMQFKKTTELANYEFLITSPEMRHPSYYFFAIEDAMVCIHS